MSVDLIGKILALSCALLWAIAVIFFKRAGDVMSPTVLNLYKTIVAAVLLLPVFWIMGISLIPAHLTGLDWLMMAASGVLGISVSDSLFFKSLNILGAGLTAIVECMYSPMIMAISWLALLEDLSMRKIGGVLLVIAAVLVATLKVKTIKLPARTIAKGILVGAGAMFFMAIGIVLMKPVLEKASVLWVAEVRLLAALVVLVIFISFNKDRKQMFHSLLNRRNWKDAFAGSILGNVLSMVTWVAAFKLTDVTSAAVLNQTNTIFIVILASLWLKEPYTYRRVIATFLAFAGSVLVLAQ